MYTYCLHLQICSILVLKVKGEVERWWEGQIMVKLGNGNSPHFSKKNAYLEEIPWIINEKCKQWDTSLNI